MPMKCSAASTLDGDPRNDHHNGPENESHPPRQGATGGTARGRGGRGGGTTGQGHAVAAVQAKPRASGRLGLTQGQLMVLSPAPASGASTAHSAAAASSSAHIPGGSTLGHPTNSSKSNPSKPRSNPDDDGYGIGNDTSNTPQPSHAKRSGRGRSTTRSGGGRASDGEAHRPPHGAGRHHAGDGENDDETMSAADSNQQTNGGDGGGADTSSTHAHPHANNNIRLSNATEPPAVVLRQIAAIACPTLISTVVGFSTQAMTSSFVGRRLGSEAFAHYTLGLSVFNLFGMSIGIGLVSALDTLISQAYGRSQQHTADLGRYVQRAVVVCAALFFPIAAVLLYGEPFFAIIFGPDLGAGAAVFTRHAVGLFAVSCINNILIKTLQAINLPNLPLMGVIVSCIVCFISNYFFTYSFAGGVYSLTAANVAMMTTMILLCRFHPGVTFWHHCRWPSRHAIEVAGLVEFMRVGVPSLVSVCAEWWAFEILDIVAASISVHAVATVNMVLAVGSMMFSVALAVSIAASVRVGNALGAAKPRLAREYGLYSMMVAQGTAFTNVFFLIVFRHQIAAIFTQDQALADTFTGMVLLVALYHWGDSTQFCLQGVYRGAGQQEGAARVVLVSLWAVGLPMTVILGRFFGLGGEGIVMGLLCGFAVEIPLLIRNALRWDWRAIALQAAQSRAAEVEESCGENAAASSSADNDDATSSRTAAVDMVRIGSGSDGGDDDHALSLHCGDADDDSDNTDERKDGVKMNGSGRGGVSTTSPARVRSPVDATEDAGRGERDISPTNREGSLDSVVGRLKQKLSPQTQPMLLLPAGGGEGGGGGGEERRVAVPVSERSVTSPKEGQTVTPASAAAASRNTSRAATTTSTSAVAAPVEDLAADIGLLAGGAFAAVHLTHTHLHVANRPVQTVPNTPHAANHGVAGRSGGAVSGSITKGKQPPSPLPLPAHQLHAMPPRPHTPNTTGMSLSSGAVAVAVAPTAGTLASVSTGRSASAVSATSGSEVALSPLSSCTLSAASVGSLSVIGSANPSPFRLGTPTPPPQRASPRPSISGSGGLPTVGLAASNHFANSTQAAGSASSVSSSPTHPTRQGNTTRPPSPPAPPPQQEASDDDDATNINNVSIDRLRTTSTVSLSAATLGGTPPTPPHSPNKESVIAVAIRPSPSSSKRALRSSGAASPCWSVSDSSAEEEAET